MTISEPLPTYLFNVDYPDILNRVERRVRGRIRTGIQAMFFDFGHEGEMGDLIADLRSGRLTTATLYRSFDVLVTRWHLMDDPVRQALDGAGLSVMRIAGRDVGAAVDRWALRATTSATASDVRFDPTDPSLITELRRTGDLYWDRLLHETVRAFHDEIERSYYANDSAAQMADRLELVAGLSPDQARTLDRLRTTMAKGPLQPVQREVALYNNAQQMREKRAEVIMRTELHRIANAGAMAYWQQMGRKGALNYNTALAKWNTHMDERTCPTCGPLDGTMIVMGGQFAPGVLSPPMHPNCRCSISLEFTVEPSMVHYEDVEKAYVRDGDGDGWVDDGKPTMRPAPVGRVVRAAQKVVHEKKPATAVKHEPFLAHGLSQDEIGHVMGNDEWNRVEWLDADGNVMPKHPDWRLGPGETKVEYRIRSPKGQIPVRQIVRHTNTPKGEKERVWPGEREGIGDYVETVGPIPYVYRVVSEADYQRMKKQGFLDTDGRGNVDPTEGLVADSDLAWTYLGDIGGMKGHDNPTGKGRALRIRVRPEDGWAADSDGYVKTKKPVPFTQVDMVSQPIGITRRIEGDPQGSHTVHTDWDYSAAPLNVYVKDDPTKYGEEVMNRSVMQPSGSPVRGTPIDPVLLPETLYHVTLASRQVAESGRLRAGGTGGLQGDENDKIVSLTGSKKIADSIKDAMKILADVALDTPESVDKGDHDAADGMKVVEAFRDAARREGWVWDPEVHEFQLTGYTFRDWANQFMWDRESKGGKKNPIFFGVTREYWANVNPRNIGVVEVNRDDIVDTEAMVTDFDASRGGGLDEYRVYGDVPIKRDRITKRRELRAALARK